MERFTRKIIIAADLKDIAARYRRQYRQIVTTNGCFDLLHAGHMKNLETSRSLGDVLIVGVNSDDDVTRLKGEKRPIQPQAIRMMQLAALSSVDYVVALPNDDPKKFIQLVKPHFHTKGEEYAHKRILERDAVEKFDGEVVLVPNELEISTSAIINLIRSNSIRR